MPLRKKPGEQVVGEMACQVVPHQEDTQRWQPLVVLMRPEPRAPARSNRALGLRRPAHLRLTLQDRLQDLGQLLFEPGMQDRIRSREHPFGTHLTSRRAKQGQQFSRASTRILMRQATRVSLHVPVLSRLGNGLIRSGFILTPQLYPGQLGNTIGQFNQALFLLCLRIVDGDDARFAHTHRRACPTPGAAASEDVACGCRKTRRMVLAPIRGSRSRRRARCSNLSDQVAL